jgi:hypothetical protein
MDFRLPWLRKHFPEARILHLWRHPRDQWCSTLRDPSVFGKDAKLEDFTEHDGYYLMNWVRDLQRHFPFLEEEVSHPYPLFYYLWKLSYIFGLAYSDVSISYESLVSNPPGTMALLADKLAVNEVLLAQGIPLIHGQPSGRWKEYAPESWFRAHEDTCEENLSRLLGTGS